MHAWIVLSVASAVLPFAPEKVRSLLPWPLAASSAVKNVQLLAKNFLMTSNVNHVPKHAAHVLRNVPQWPK